MDPHDVPPPYSDVSKQPSAPTYPSRGYAPISEPTYEPPHATVPMPATNATVPMAATTTHTTVTITPAGNRHVPGSCPVCGNTSWTGTYSCFAWFLCIFCFWNCGLCCCLCMRKKKCTKCAFTLN